MMATNNDICPKRGITSEHSIWEVMKKSGKKKNVDVHEAPNGMFAET